VKRIDTATKAVDLFGAGKHGFRDSNKSLGIAATDLDAGLFNNVQEEICRVIEAAGIALDGAVYNQLLLALREPGVFITPAQFDNTTKGATTEFVQRALGNWSGQTNYAGAQVLTPQDIGKIIVAGGNITLPLASQATPGARIMIVASNATRTIYPQGADTLGTGGDGQNVASFSLSSQSFVIIQRLLGTTGWIIYEGDAALRYSPLFSSSLASNGYQKLPSGLIIQWGGGTTSASGVVAVTYPITFPTGALQSFVSDRSSIAASGSNDIVSCDDGTASGMNVYSISDAGVAKTTNFKWFSIGY